jgi:DNA-binding protein YbaB
MKPFKFMSCNIALNKGWYQAYASLMQQMQTDMQDARTAICNLRASAAAAAALILCSGVEGF